MTTTVNVKAHTSPDYEVVVIVASEDGDLLEREILQDGQETNKYAYNGRKVIVLERKRETDGTE